MYPRKAQGGEMIGLLVIVLLLFSLLGIYVRFASAPKQTQSSLRTNIESENLLGAMLDTTVCVNTNFEDVVKACAENTEICGRKSCELLNEKTTEMLKAALGKEYEKGFEFYINDSAGNMLVKEGLSKTGKRLVCQGRALMPASKQILPNIGYIVIKRCA